MGSLGWGGGSETAESGQTIVSFGIYIHIPFCQAKCSYCHFTTELLQRETADKYNRALITEIELFAESLDRREKVDSIYLGGGTPSLVPADHIAGVLNSCRRNFLVAIDCEISLEANPGTLSTEKAQAFRSMGLNRISVGGQSFCDRELASIGRIHSPEMIEESLSQLRASGFVNINLDLMLGLPLQTAESWKRNLEKAICLGIPHISVYMLDLDDPCPLKEKVADGSVSIPGEDFVSDLYMETIDFLAANGRRHYEISNFARPEFFCSHNLKYWKRKPVFGFGLASHSFDGQIRYANHRHMPDYLQAIESCRSPIEWRESIGESEAFGETLFLGLRLTEGVDWDRLTVGQNSVRAKDYERSLKKLVSDGLIEWKGSIVRLTPRGMLLSNEVFQLFV
jgi:oxygen-independent coproporphyrinogen III oxidase